MWVSEREWKVGVVVGVGGAGVELGLEMWPGLELGLGLGLELGLELEVEVGLELGMELGMACGRVDVRECGCEWPREMLGLPHFCLTILSHVVCPTG